jgi:hypothetical protein
MTTIKDLADSLDIPQSRLKKLALELLGCIPAELSADDEAQIRSAIAQTTKALAASQGDDSPIVPASSTDTLTPAQSRVAEVLGESVVKRLIKAYLAELQAEYQAQKFSIDTLQFELEQRFYSQLSSYQESTQNESINRIKRNSNYFSLEGLKALPANDSDDDLLTEINSFLECFNYE